MLAVAWCSNDVMSIDIKSRNLRNIRLTIILQTKHTHHDFFLLNVQLNMNKIMLVLLNILNKKGKYELSQVVLSATIIKGLGKMIK